MMRQLTKLALLVALAPAFVACGEDEDRYEEIAKLRAFGSSSLPVVAQPSTAAAPQLITITVFAAVPLGETVNAEPFEDEGSPDDLSLPVTMVPGSEKYEDHPTFRIFSVQATQPTLPEEVFAAIGRPFYNQRFGVRLAAGSEEENVVGSTLVYPAGAPELARTVHTIEITKPAAGEVSGTEDLEATITDPAGEAMRIGWFVSGGMVKNRRARETEWETPSAGPASLIVTSRGRKTGAFAFKVLDVTVQ